MKKILVLAAAIALVSSTAFAAGDATLLVSAEVKNACVITTGGTLVFPALDPTVGGEVTANSADVTVTCTNGATGTVTSDAADNPLTNLDGGPTIPFTLTLPAVTGTGSAQPYVIGGTIAAGTYTNALTGDFDSNVTLTIAP